MPFVLFPSIANSSCPLTSTFIVRSPAAAFSSLSIICLIALIIFVERKPAIIIAIIIDAITTPTETYFIVFACARIVL